MTINWPAAVTGAQMYSALAWLAIVLRYSGSTARLLAGRGRAWDAACAWAWAAGIVQVGFIIRWLYLVTGEINAASTPALKIWAVLYVVNATVAIGILYTYRDGDTSASFARARHGLVAWFVVGGGCLWGAWVTA